MSMYISKWIQETGSKHDPDVESVSTFTDDIIKTPATTTEFNFPSYAPRNMDAMNSHDTLKNPGCAPAVPQPGRTHKIRLRDTNQLITLEGGQLQLQSSDSGPPGGGWIGLVWSNLDGLVSAIMFRAPTWDVHWAGVMVWWRRRITINSGNSYVLVPILVEGTPF